MTTETRRATRLNPLVIGLSIALIILLCAIPLLLMPESGFGGSDGAGLAVIAHLAPDYDSTWTTNWWAPPGSETESMLFALQAALGGMLIGYFFGYLRGREKFYMRHHPRSFSPIEQY